MAIRRAVPATAQAAAAPQVQYQAPTVAGVNFLRPDFYVSGAMCPDGDYTWKDLQVMMDNPTRPGVQSRLGVMITLSQSGAEDRQQFYSMGSKAALSFTPGLDGKSLVIVPGGPFQNLMEGTNWMELLKSLWNTGMPRDFCSNNLGPLVGIKTHMQNVPEPEERKSFRSNTGEAGMSGEQQPNRTILVVGEVYSAPWESKTSPLTATSKAQGFSQAPPPPVNGSTADDSAIEAAAMSAISSVIEKNAKGLPRLLLRTEVFKAVKASEGDAMASNVVQYFFEPGMEDNLFGVLGQLGYKLNGSNIQPA